jgi:hypothetical protein
MYRQVELCYLLDPFAKFRKATVNCFCLSVCLSFHPHGTLIFIKIGVWIFFENLLRNSKFYLNLTRMTGTLHEDQYTYLIISGSILLRMRNPSSKICIENQNTFYVP